MKFKSITLTSLVNNRTILFFLNEMYSNTHVEVYMHIMTFYQIKRSEKHSFIMILTVGNDDYLSY